MKILGGVPSRKRSTAGAAAEILSEYCEEVLVVSQGALVKSYAANIKVWEQSVDIGMKKARNIIFDWAGTQHADFIIQADDDIKFKPEILREMIDIMVSEPALGALSSAYRAFANWNKDVTCTKPFQVFQCPTQLWIIRMETIREVGNLAIDVLEDIELGLRMWGAGWICAIMHKGISLTHNPFISRMGKGDDQGGQPESLRKRKMPDSVDYIWEHHNAVLKSFSVARPGSNRTYNARYDWEEMCRLARDRFTYIGYEDSRGRVI